MYSLGVVAVVWSAAIHVHILIIRWRVSYCLLPLGQRKLLKSRGSSSLRYKIILMDGALVTYRYSSKRHLTSHSLRMTD